MRKVGHCIDEYDDFMLCNSGQTKGRYGVGFIIKKYLKPCVINFIGLSDRVALLDIDINDTPITIIQVYAPTEESEEVEIESFYETLHRAHANSSKYTIVMGDFNAKVGQKDTEENKLLGRFGFGFGKRSSRGQLLIQYAQEYNLSIMNTFLKKKPSRKWTWKSPDQTTMNEIDYILTNFPNKFKDVHVLNNIKFPSDHRMVVNIESSAESSPETVMDTCRGNDPDTAVPPVEHNKKPKTEHKEKVSIRSAVEKIRFLTLSPQQFAAGPARSSLLSESEAFAVLMNILSTTTDVPLPAGFSTSRVPRKQLIGGGPCYVRPMNTVDNAVPRLTVDRVAVRLPPFWPEDSKVWFVQAEAQIQISGIKEDTMKFYHIISQLDQSSLEVAELADKICEVTSAPLHQQVASSSATAVAASSNFDGLLKRIDDMIAARIQTKLRQQIAQLSIGQRSRSPSRGRYHPRRRSRSRTPGRQFVEVTDDCQGSTGRLFITDRKTNVQYLIDTGSDLCVLPRRFLRQFRQATDYSLTGANGSVINTYGTMTLHLDLGLRRDFVWNFVVANVDKPIIGADFIAHYGLLVDCKNRRLIDRMTKLVTPGTIKICNQTTSKQYQDLQCFADHDSWLPMDSPENRSRRSFGMALRDPQTHRGHQRYTWRLRKTVGDLAGTTEHSMRAPYLTDLCGVQLRHTTACHPAANGMVERFHRTLKAAIMAHDDKRWTDILPVVLLGARAAWKEDLQCSVAEMVYGERLRIPGEFLQSTYTNQLKPSDFVSQLRHNMSLLRPQEASRHSPASVFVHDDLKSCKHVFIRKDAVRGSMEPPYSGPYLVLDRTNKTVIVKSDRGPVTVSMDRVKPAYILIDTLEDSPRSVGENPDGQRPMPTFTVDTPSPVTEEQVWWAAEQLPPQPRPWRQEGIRVPYSIPNPMSGMVIDEMQSNSMHKIYCQRAILQHTECLNTSALDCSVTFMVDKNIYVLGVQVPTQSPTQSASDLSGGGGSGGYSELLYAHLLDADGARLSYTHYTNRVPYRHLLDIMFNRRIYIQRNKVYKVGIVFNKVGWYPMGTCAQQVAAESVFFNFGIGHSSDSVRDGLIRSIIFTY
ncbi:unnamed protein product [Euphydryas editha]|uniref:Peptidase A2 domain-containing protein n=1 Tax=Euphydryas editha TaxID=104508 RepID=A0AAU9V189_EUPED|nr:unnamed protein product [Euphydryas editha]